MQRLRNALIIGVLTVAAAVVPGCITIYKTAVDVRDAETIAADTKIKLKILDRFVDDEKIKTLDIFTACYEGDVYLVGQYEDPAQKTRAVKIANGVEGVKSVTTHMLPKKEDPECTTKVNLKITANLKSKLLKDQSIHGTNIDVKTIQCNVVLVGLVHNKGEADKAVEHAKTVENVRKITSYIKYRR